jgi:hypothetical protein
MLEKILNYKTMTTPNDPKGAIGATKTPLALIPPNAELTHPESKP